MAAFSPVTVLMWSCGLLRAELLYMYLSRRVSTFERSSRAVGEGDVSDRPSPGRYGLKR